MDRADALAVVIQSEELPVCVAGIEYRMLDSVSNIKDVDDAALLASTLPEERPINYESQIFVRACNRTVVLNVDLRSDSVEDVKRVIEEREGIPAREQHLNLGGKPLQDGTFLRDYDALGDQPTINVSLRIRGGNRTMRHEKLKDLVKQHPMTCDTHIPEKEAVKVLSEFGQMILHGVLTCFLSAHRAGLAYAGAFAVENLMGHVYQQQGADELVVSRVYYIGSDGVEPPSLPPLDDEEQKKDYAALKEVIKKLLKPEPSRWPLHVESLYKLLDTPDSLMSSANTRGPNDLVMRRTHLLQAHAAIVGSPVAVATMCFNLKRFYDQLDKDKEQFLFEQAVRAAQQRYSRWREVVRKQPLLEGVYNFRDDGSAPNNPYDAETGMELFKFARNWFTHVPEERWGKEGETGDHVGSTTQPDGGTEKFTGLPHLDYIFTYHLPYFIPEALLQLYKTFKDYKLLTQALVPLA